jgi:hypothetical protein
MVKDVERLRASIFERTGIAIDEHDPIMAVVAGCAYQTEEIGARLLKRTNPSRAVLASAVVSFAFAAVAAGATWHIANATARAERLEWARLQANPRVAALLNSEQGRAGMRLAAAGVASMLANCDGRASWKTREGYCVPMTRDGRPDGFRTAVSETDK